MRKSENKSLIDGSADCGITEAKKFVMSAVDAVVYGTFKSV